MCDAWVFGNTRRLLVCFGGCFWEGIGGLGRAVVVVVFIAVVANYHAVVLVVGCLVERGGVE